MGSGLKMNFSLSSAFQKILWSLIGAIGLFFVNYVLTHLTSESAIINAEVKVFPATIVSASHSWRDQLSKKIEEQIYALREKIPLEGNEARNLSTDVLSTLRSSDAEYRRIQSRLDQIRSTYLIEISNTGEKPAKAVYMQVPSAVAYAKARARETVF